MVGREHQAILVPLLAQVAQAVAVMATQLMGQLPDQEPSTQEAEAVAQTAQLEPAAQAAQALLLFGMRSKGE